MGGHGGLNILPQKSWNVYGRENRLKVARDEAKHEEEQRVKAEKQRLAESEARRAFLLRQAALKRGDDPERAQLPEQPAQAEQPAGLLQHINFFVEHEARELHPEVVEEAKAEARRRGDAQTQTSDARFDARFQLGYGLTGSSNQPWYAKRGPSLLTGEAAEQQPDHGQPLTLPGVKSNGSLIETAAGAQPLLLLTGGGKAKERHRKEKPAKEKRSKARGKDKKGEKESGKEKAVHLERLREERRQRERVEREHARQAIMAVDAGRGTGRDGYNAAYGNVAPSKMPGMKAR